ncbi:putative retrovirus-related Pol polyprotein from transposon TNT 1-94 [Phytophthora infestans]|uniref:Putative retrovirus-related Pol polyprotein from transposon TNT 1-94 n=1 Tax=Phytophthora infestans TaxID=4787 RepID=A0A833W8K8_PHYIN|nr:putative retrovirus-related Pol polyprotein from transposon TNT 1-94 [Phytophthora infestans]
MLPVFHVLETLLWLNLLNSRTKHIDVRHHYIRERIELHQIDVKRVPGSENVVDAFTKPHSSKGKV